MEHTFSELRGLNLIFEAINKAADHIKTRISSYEITQNSHSPPSQYWSVHVAFTAAVVQGRMNCYIILLNISVYRLLQCIFLHKLFSLKVPTKINIQKLSHSFDAFLNHQSSRKMATGCTVSCLCRCNAGFQGCVKTT